MPLPLLPTRATCGFPSPAEDFYGEGDDLDLNERVITNPPATFFVEADTGTSMVDFGIFPGDALVVDRSLTAKHGDIVMVLWQGGYMIKQWCPTADGLQLRSGNQETATIHVGPEDELEVWGVVTWSFRKQFRR
ncbi:Error-prone repair protein UmuD [Lysobacter sp. A03]|nr:Error-prone repair protein UmuD [Lysobacter sp. A03]